jgi:hypothetical protein
MSGNKLASTIARLLPKPHTKRRPKGILHPVKGQKRLNALRDGAVPAGKQLNPYGKFGNCYRSRHRLGDLDHLAYRPEAMKRKRLKLKEEKKIALEMHELTQLARESASDAMKTLIEISQNKRAPEPARIAASAVILDRGYGKASQVTMSASLNNGKAKEITGDELERRIRNTLKRVEELTTGVPKAPQGKKRPSHLH